MAEQFRIICARQNVHFLDAKDCAFNQVDFMHLTCKGHAQLAEMLAKKFLHCSDFLIPAPSAVRGFFCSLYCADKWAILFADFTLERTLP